MNRRRLASLVSIIAASVATLGTSYAQTPPPTVETRLEGSFELTEERPVAVQQFRLNADGFAADANGTTVVFTPSAVLDSGTGVPPDVRLRIVAANARPTDQHGAFRSLSELERTPPSLGLDCSGNACEGRFALIAEWADPEDVGRTTFDWRVDADVELWAGADVGEPRVSMTAEDSGGPPHLNATRGEPDPVRLDARHRIAYWRAFLSLGGEEPLATRATWPIVATGRLSPVTNAGDGQDDEPIALQVLILEPSGSMLQAAGFGGDSIEFDPFWACEPAADCVVEYVFGLGWNDHREEASVDAGWDLDLRVIGADGSDVPVGIEFEPVPPMPMAVGTTSGSLLRGQTYSYSIAVPADIRGDATWDGLGLPAYAILRATLRSTGSAPLPPDSTVDVDPNAGSSLELRVDETSSVVFDPTAYGRCIVGTPCDVSGLIGLSGSGRELPPDASYRIDWELEIGAGVNDPALTTLEIVESLPTPAPIP